MGRFCQALGRTAANRILWLAVLKKALKRAAWVREEVRAQAKSTRLVWPVIATPSFLRTCHRLLDLIKEPFAVPSQGLVVLKGDGAF